MDIIDEIKYNQFRNELNRKYFHAQLEHFFKNDPVIVNHYKSDFVVLKRDFNKSDNKYIQILCVEILKKFKNGDYFNRLYQYLHDILLNPSWSKKDEDNINNITQSIIVEFIIKGYSLQTIRKFASNIFKNYSFTNEGYIYSNFPHNIDSKTFYNKEVFDREAYNKAVKGKIDSLTTSDRLAGINNYFNQKYKDCFFIFHISGLKGDIDITIGDVNFYSPNVKKYIKKSKLGPFIENEAIKVEGEACLMNCAVKIRHLDTEKTKSDSIEKIDNIEDILIGYKIQLNRVLLKLEQWEVLSIIDQEF